MRFAHARVAPLCAGLYLSIAALFAAAAFPALAQEAKSRPGYQVLLRAGPPLTRPTFVAPDVDGDTRAKGSTFNVTYIGFSDEAKAAFQRAVDIWAGRIQSNVPINVEAHFEPLGAGILGSAGPGNLYKNFTGAPVKGFWYASATANKLARRQLDKDPDIIASFSSAFPNWHFGADAAATDTYDFTTVVLHELGHGLGFIGLASVSAGKGTGTVLFQGSPGIYSQFVQNGAGAPILSVPDPSIPMKQQLESSDLFFNSSGVRKANRGSAAKIYAPQRFQSGSSYSHLDEASFPAGNPNSLMTPQLGMGETIHDPGRISIAIMGAVGW